MPDAVIPSAEGHAVPIRLVAEGAGIPDGRVAAWARANGFKGARGELLAVPGDDGERSDGPVGRRRGLRSHDRPRPGPRVCPPGTTPSRGCRAATRRSRRWPSPWEPTASTATSRSKDKGAARLVAPEGVDLGDLTPHRAAAALAREMVDTPAADMGPLQIETIAREIAEESGAAITVTTGDALLEANYPAVHAVGRAATALRAPRLIEIGWNLDQVDLPLVALVGKGVVFDTGGLDIKPAAGMRNMKKDMGGSAHALALGRLVMQAGLKVRLVVLVAAVENAISADAFRPGDILSTRAGLTVEVGNTDAEGRLVLADALARAGEHQPDLTLDFATLTGAARIALGPELPPVYTDDEPLAAELLDAARRVRDPVVAHALVARLPRQPEQRDGRSAQRFRRLGPGRIGDRRPVPATLRAEDRGMGASGHLRLESAGPAGTS